MSVTREQVLGIAALARLRLTAEEAALFADQLSVILDHMAELDGIDSPDAETDAVGGGSPLRPDEPPPDPLTGPIDGFAPERSQGFFTVPRLAAMAGDPATGGDADHE